MSFQERQRPVTVERKNERTPHRPKPWSHQQELQRARGRMIKIQFTQDAGGMAADFKLIEADQFTVLVEGDDKSRMIYLKSSIIGFMVL